MFHASFRLLHLIINFIPFNPSFHSYNLLHTILLNHRAFSSNSQFDNIALFIAYLVQIHRGNLTEIVKNNANRPPVKSTPPNITTPTVAVKSTPINRTATVKAPPKDECDIGADDDNIVDDNNELSRQLSKMDIIKKFDNKYREEEKPQPPVQLAAVPDNANSLEATDDGGDRFGDGHNSEQSSFDDETASPPLSATPASAAAAANTSAGTPPKPLPRTSRNNSMSDQGVTSGASDDSCGSSSERSRPVARPRTAATYKVD